MDQPVTGWRRFFSMEPLAFMLMFAYSISSNVMTDLIVYQTCKKLAGLNVSECDILHENSSSEEAKKILGDVQPFTGRFFIIQSFIDVVYPTILALFLGPWSDKNGRKPLLLIPFIGQVFSFASMAFLSSLDVNPYWFLLASLPNVLCGGFSPILMAFFCYITDITNKENRAWHLACLDTTIFSGILAGLFIGPVIYINYGYYAVFAISSAVTVLAVLHVALFVKETIENENGRSIRDLFDVSLVKDLFSTVTKKREGYDRCLIYCCIAVIAMHVMAMEGNLRIGYLFSSKKLGWNIEDYSIYSGIQIIINISGMLLLIKFAGSFLKVPDVVLITISCLSNCAGCFMKAFVMKPWHMYLSSSIGMFSAATVPIMRSVISKCVSQKDVGKIFSITTITEMIVPLGSSAVYTIVYNHTLDLYPSPVWFLSSGLTLLMIVLAVVIEKCRRKLNNSLYTSFNEN